MKSAEPNDRQRRFIEAVARGIPAQEAARSVGYSPAYSRKASRLLKVPVIAQAIAAIREQGRTIAAYGLVEAMKEAESAATFARVNKNSMALVKASELRAKLSGLLIDRVEIAYVDLTGALAAARSRASIQVVQDETRNHDN
jgi:phage terminase small subunit